MRVNFQQIKLTGRKSGKCGCGKVRTRSMTFVQTINPWNKNAKGEPKNSSEILHELGVERDEWKKLPITCDNCKV